MTCFFKKLRLLLPWETKKIHGFLAAVLIAGCVLWVIALSFAPVGHYYAARAHMDRGDYTDAYFHLLKCRHFKDSQKLLKDFVVHYESIVTREAVYDETGNEIYLRETKQITRYDQNRNTTQLLNYDGDGQLSSMICSEYTADGDFLRSVTYASDGTIASTQENIYTYDQAGRITKEESYYDGQRKRTYTYTYDSAGNIAIQTVYKENGQIAETHFYCYDSAGNKTEEKHMDNTGAVFCLYHYEYDENGNTIWYFADVYGSQNTTSWRYNEGNLAEQISYHTNGMTITHYAPNGETLQRIDYNKDNQPVRKIEYALDREGNPIHQSIYAEDGSVRSYRTHAYLYDQYGVPLKQIRYSSDGMQKAILLRSHDHKTQQNTLYGYLRGHNDAYYVYTTVTTIASQPVAFYQPKA